MPNRTAAAMNIAIQTFVDSLPAGAVRSLSVDRGKEFATYTSVTKALQIKLYVADPYSSWQRGSIENHHGLLREFYPKEKDFTTVSVHQLSSAVALINYRPRKYHQWRSTRESFLAAVSVELTICIMLNKTVTNKLAQSNVQDSPGHHACFGSVSNGTFPSNTSA